MPRILLAEDDEIMRISVSDSLKKQGWRVEEAEDGLKAMALFDRHQYNLVISDIRMPGMDGLTLLKKVRQQSPETAIVIMTAYGSVDAAIDCLRQGATDYVLKPFDMDDIIIRISRILETQAVMAKCEVLQATCERDQQGYTLYGSSPVMEDVYSLIDQAAPSSSTILITGESGTGKELAARSIHNASERSKKPFIAINCAAIPDGLMESEFFGHERGAFTGADHSRKGKFELADQGTLLLDELGELPGPLQAKLLRVLQESQLERVGGSKTISVDVRILACTSKDLQKEVEEGRFRQDLLYRLQVIPLKMPPLRDHKEDIEELCRVFLREFNLIHGRNVQIEAEAITTLKQYDFPGNARELKNLVERAFVLCRGDEIGPGDFPSEINCPIQEEPTTFNLADQLAILERKCLRKALKHCGDNRTEAAKLLGISRKNLWEKLKTHCIG